MKTSIALCIIVTLILSSCAHHKPREKSLQNYNNAVQMLAGKIAEKLKGYDRQSFFIYNANAREGEECELSRRFIGAMSNYLANRGIKIKRKELVTWGRATGQFFKVECQEVLETLASDFLIEFSLKKCPGSANCMEAGVRAIACESNVIRFSAKEAFSLKGNVADWYRQKHKLPRVKGSRENPYSDYREAANYMVGRLFCIAKSMMSNDETMCIIVGKTESASSDIASAFSEAVSSYGFKQVIPDNWLPVAIRGVDQFELGIYQRKRKELFETANVVLGVNMEQIDVEKIRLIASLLTLQSIKIIKDGKSETLGAGEMIPYCVSRGYTLSFSPNSVRIISRTSGSGSENLASQLSQNLVSDFKTKAGKRGFIVYEETDRPAIVTAYQLSINVHLDGPIQSRKIPSLYYWNVQPEIEFRNLSSGRNIHWNTEKADIQDPKIWGHSSHKPFVDGPDCFEEKIGKQFVKSFFGEIENEFD